MPINKHKSAFWIDEKPFLNLNLKEKSLQIFKDFSNPTFSEPKELINSLNANWVSKSALKPQTPTIFSLETLF